MMTETIHEDISSELQAKLKLAVKEFDDLEGNISTGVLAKKHGVSRVDLLHAIMTHGKGGLLLGVDSKILEEGMKRLYRRYNRKKSSTVT